MEKHAKVGDFVKVHFTGKLEDGSIFESSDNNKPLRFQIGKGSVIQGFNDAVIGMQLGQEKYIHISSDKAYGPIEKELVIKIEKEKLPDDLAIKIGQQLQIPGEEGNYILVRITNITNKYIELDGNHPVAGKNLIFNIKLIEIE